MLVILLGCFAGHKRHSPHLGRLFDCRTNPVRAVSIDDEMDTVVARERPYSIRPQEVAEMIGSFVGNTSSLNSQLRERLNG